MERIEFDIHEVQGLQLKYALLMRLRRGLDSRGCALLGFRLDQQLVALVEGPPNAIALAIRGTKGGTVRQLMHHRRPPYLGPTKRRCVYDPGRALVEMHREAAGPLSNPWTSHRDLMGFRSAPFFDRSVWANRIDPRRVHLDAGGGPLPFGWPPALATPVEDLGLPLRIAAAVLGLVPADPKSFRLFAHLARWAGTAQITAARALMVTPRRIRQLITQPEPNLQAAALALTDERLRVVP